MNKIYYNPNYNEVREMMHDRLVQMREKYGDSDELNKMHLERYLSFR